MISLTSLLDNDFWKQHLLHAIDIAGGVLEILIFFIGVRFLCNRLIERVLKTVTEREVGSSTLVAARRIRTLGTLIKSTLFYVLIFISGVMFLGLFKIDPTPVLTAAGVVGLAVGFGAQKLVRDIISGFFILLENQYSVGEYVTIGLITGTVVELGMRVTQLRDDVGKLITIANGDIGIVTNHSRGPIQAFLEVSVVPDSDLAHVRSVIDRIGDELVSEIEGMTSAPRASGITALDSTKVTIRIACEVKPGRQDAAQVALRERIRQRFAEEGIGLV